MSKKGVKRGEGEEEGIYLLAKDLAYNVALDQTTKLTEGIKLLQRKELHEVSKAINILDPSKGTNNGICKKGAYKHTGGSAGEEIDEKCGVKKNSEEGKETQLGLDLLWTATNNSTSGGGNYVGDNINGNVGPKTSAKISKDVSALNREQKGVVSSAFAKAHEGAETPA